MIEIYNMSLSLFLHRSLARQLDDTKFNSFVGLLLPLLINNSATYYMEHTLWLFAKQESKLKKRVCTNLPVPTLE